MDRGQARARGGWKGASKPHKWWIDLHNQYVAELQAHERAGGAQVLFYGDSITESWRETCMGGPSRQAEGTALVFEQHFGSYRSLVLAIGGDETENLMWRLQHGELPLARPAKVAVVMIGTNDVGIAADERSSLRDIAVVADRIQSTVSYIRAQCPQTAVLLLAIPPCGPSWPNRATPYSTAVNERLAAYAAETAGVRFLDCGVGLVVDGKVPRELVPDGLHPSAAGMAVMAGPIAEALKQILGGGGKLLSQEVHRSSAQISKA